MLQGIPLQDNLVMHKAPQLFGVAAGWDRAGEQEGTQHFSSVTVSTQCTRLFLMHIKYFRGIKKDMQMQHLGICFSSGLGSIMFNAGLDLKSLSHPKFILQ